MSTVSPATILVFDREFLNIGACAEVSCATDEILVRNVQNLML
jgi:hypothetical protein